MTYEKRGTIVAEQYTPTAEQYVAFAVQARDGDAALIRPTYSVLLQDFIIYPGDYFVTFADGTYKVMRREVFEGLFKRC